MCSSHRKIRCKGSVICLLVPLLLCIHCPQITQCRDNSIPGLTQNELLLLSACFLYHVQQQFTQVEKVARYGPFLNSLYFDSNMCLVSHRFMHVEYVRKNYYAMHHCMLEGIVVGTESGSSLLSLRNSAPSSRTGVTSFLNLQL